MTSSASTARRFRAQPCGHRGGLARRSFAPRAARRQATSSSSPLLHAGIGTGFCQIALACADKRLVRAPPNPFSLDTRVAMHEGLRRSPRCKAVFDELVAALAQYSTS